MQQILFFLIRNKNFLLFLGLFIISIALTIQSHSYHKNKFINSSNFVSGCIYSFKSSVTDYFHLKKENKLLHDENVRIREQLESFKDLVFDTNIDTSFLAPKYKFISATIINNSYFKSKNRITINKGLRDTINIDMGVVSSKGLVGIIENVSSNYATILSILNTNSQINTKLKNSNHFGTLLWDTKDPNIVQLIDIPRLAPVFVGDTVTTGGMSTIFPKGILIGTIKDYYINQDKNSYTLNIKLFNDMTNLEHVYIIESFDSEEIKMLENKVDDAK